jgi:formylmethanofuran dehydrogenase subunit E
MTDLYPKSPDIEKELVPLNIVAECESCGKMIFENEHYLYMLDDIYLCKNCAPEGVAI